MAKRSHGLSLEAARAHALRHGYDPQERVLGKTATFSTDAATGLVGPKLVIADELPKPVKMTRPEREYGMILEAMKRKGEIVDYRFQGMSLPWGADPVTGRQMRYKCDWLVITTVGKEWYHQGGGKPNISEPTVGLKLIEVKGAHIWKDDRTRFKGCRAEWPMFQFEMHQLTRGEWRRIQ